jgi:hypothetical protein
VDVGRGGDPSALIKRRGNHVLEPVKLWRDADVMVTVGRVVREYADTPDWQQPSSICVDMIGIGAGVYDRLRELGLSVVGINVGETQSLQDTGRFVRRRDELHYAIRVWFAARDVCIPNDPVLISELSAPSYKLTSSGKISVETKDELKARGLKSPNAADALALTFAVGDQRVHGRLPTRSIDADYDIVTNYETGGRAYEPRSSGYWTGPGWAPVWHGAEHQQTHAINEERQL